MTVRARHLVIEAGRGARRVVRVPVRAGIHAGIHTVTRLATRVGGGLFLGLCLGLVVRAPLAAQEAPPEPVGYSHYWPGSCVEAVARNDQFESRGAIDTARYTPAVDTMFTSSVEIAKTCLAALVVDSVRPRDLLLLARTYLAAGDPAGAAGAIARRLEADSLRPDSTRAHTLADIVSLYLDAKPMRPDGVTETLTRLDSMTAPDAAYWQFTAHDLVGQRARRVNDDSALVREANAMIEVGKRLSAHDRQEFSGRLVSAYWYLADHVGTDADSSGPAKAIVAQARADLGNIPNLDRSLQILDSLAGFFGNPAPHVYADTWFPPADAPPGDTIHPRPGKVSLIVTNMANRWNTPIFRRLQTIVPDSVDITFIHNSYGYFGSFGALKPEEEAVAVQSVFRDSLHAPGTLAIVVPRFEVLPDGRRIPARTRNQMAYGANVGVAILVVDRNGTIRRTFPGIEPWTELEIEDLLRKIQ